MDCLGWLWLAAALAPGPAEWVKLGMTRAAGNDLGGAAAAFQRACELAPREENACYFLGRALFALNRYEEAVVPLEKALRAASRDTRWRVHWAAARNFEVLGRPAEAEQRYRLSIQFSRGRPPAAENPKIDYGAFLFRQGRAAEALQPLEEAAAAEPKSSRAQAELGRALLEVGRAGDAALRLETAISLQPGNWAAHLLLGKAYYRLGRKEDGDRATHTGHQGLAKQDYGSSTSR